MRLRAEVSLVVTCLAILAGGGTPATGATLLIGSSDVSAHADEDTTTGQYYTLSYRLPANLSPTRIERAVLEVYVDVGAKVRDDYINDAPMLEVCALKQPYSGTLVRADLDLATDSARPIARGRARRVMVDITEIFRAQLSGRLENNGLVVGTLTGPRDGDFTILSNRLPGGAVGRVLIYTR